MRLTRRELGVSLVSAAAAAQTPAPPPPASPDALLAAARNQMKSMAMTLQQQEIPRSTEPAFSFHA